MPFALLVFCAIVVGCGDKKVKPRVEDPEKEPTQVSRDLISTESRDGVRSYRMTTPVMKRYELAKEPFSEFEQGIHVETFNDTTHLVEADLVADYAHFNEKQELWEARGNVVGRNVSGDKTLYTEQLFWDQKSDRIYTDKVARVEDGKSVYVGTGFESDGAFKQWTFRSSRGQMEVKQDSTAVDTVAVAHDQQPIEQ